MSLPTGYVAGVESGPVPVSTGAIPGWWLPDARIGWRADGRPVPRLVAASSAQARHPSRGTPGTRPIEPIEPIVARLLDGTRATPAGRFFEPVLAGSSPSLPAPPGMFTVHLETGPAGFQVNGQPVPPTLLARLIRACPEWRGRPLLMLPHPQPTPNRLAVLVRALIAGLRVPVYTADAGVWRLPGIALTGTTFRRWSGPADGRSEPAASVAVGRWLPHPVDPALRVGGGGAPLAPHPTPRPEPLRLPAGGRMAGPRPMPGVVRRVLPASTPWSPPAPASLAGAPSLGAASRNGNSGPALSAARNVLLGASSPARLAASGPPAAGSAGENPAAGRVSDRVSSRVSSDVSDRAARNGLSGRGPSGDTVAGSGGAGDGSVRGGAEARDLLPWLAVPPRVAVEDRERLRSLLGWRYEAHARAVLSALALQPGLRSGPGPDDLLAGLVAVRAYLSAGGGLDAAGRSVDAVLRDAQRRPDEDDLVLLGRCTQAGIGRLPAVVGPVFRPAAPDPGVVRRCRAGDMLVEPAFLEVSTTPWELPGRTVEYVIWSSTARRTAWLGLDSPSGRSPGRALFLAGTRFVVLGVDVLGVDVPGVDVGDGAENAGNGAENTGKSAENAGTGEAPVRVLLREVVGGRADSGQDERALGRLRDALAGRSSARMGGPDTEPARVPAHLRFAVGLGDGDRPFALDGARRADVLEADVPGGDVLEADVLEANVSEANVSEPNVLEPAGPS